MTIIIRVYMLLCASLLLFDICFLLVQNQRSLVAYRINRKLEDQIRGEIRVYRESGAFSPGFPETLRQALPKTRNLLTLQGVLEEDAQAREWFRPFVFAQLKEYTSRDDYEQAYYTYVLSTFDYRREKPTPEFVDDLMGFLDSKSLYTFANTMNCLYAVGLTTPLMRAMDKVNERAGFYHKKLLVDGLLSARVEGDALSDRLVDKFDTYTPYIQDCLLDYFRLCGYDASGLCMRILTDGKANDQVRYTAMRYFAKYPSADSRAYFLRVLGNEDAPWIEQMLSIQALRQYSDREVYDIILKKITSPNWHVRVNAVQYLHGRGLSRADIFDILYQKDRYANETLLYQFRGDKEMTRYIVDTIQLLSVQDATVDASSDVDNLCAASGAAI